jgi:hypothetical protein
MGGSLASSPLLAELLTHAVGLGKILSPLVISFLFLFENKPSQGKQANKLYKKAGMVNSTVTWGDG